MLKQFLLLRVAAYQIKSRLGVEDALVTATNRKRRRGQAAQERKENGKP